MTPLEQHAAEARRVAAERRRRVTVAAIWTGVVVLCVVAVLAWRFW